MSAKLPQTRWRLIAIWIIFLFLIGIFAQQNWSSYSLQTPQWARIILPDNLQPRSTPEPDLNYIKESQIVANIQTERKNQALNLLEINPSLQKVARLVTLELEDQQSLDIPDNLQPLLTSVNPAIPSQVEAISIFVNNHQGVEKVLEEVDSQLFSNQSYTQLGVATREAKLQQQNGTLIAILASPDFAPPPTPSSQKNTRTAVPEYTGQDLWQAVQNYRRAHQLALFEQSNELCTVASIRLNEQLELGKLDNHDGFGPRAEQFFEQHPDWTAINENLAGGYDTAVAAVEWGWDQSLGHQALIQSQDYPYACAAANHGFAVLITGDK